MPTLSSSIVKNRIASMRDVEEALARQVLYGGDLATNLLELASVREDELTQLLADSHSLPPAGVGELPRATDAVLRLVPGELAQRHAFYPLEEREGALVIAVSEPLPPEVEEDLCFALSVGLEQRAAPVVRIRQAIARDYGLPLDRRTLRLVAKLEGRPDPSPSSIPGPMLRGMQSPTLPRPASVPPIVYPPETGLQPPGVHREPPPTLAEPMVRAPVQTAAVERSVTPPPAETHAATTRRDGARTLPSIPAAKIAKAIEQLPSTKPEPEQRSRSPQPRPEVSNLGALAEREAARRRRRGPYTAAMAERDLMEASSRDDVLRAFFDFASQYFEYSALFAVHGDIAEGRDAHGPGASAERVMGIGVALDLPGALSGAKRDGSWRLYRLENEGLDKSLAKDLERPTGKQVLLLPVIVRGRCVLILYGDHGGTDVELSEVGDVISFGSLVAVALERVILRKKLAARREVGDARPSGLPPLSGGAQRRRVPLPSKEERAKALASVLDVAPKTEAPRTQAATPAAKSAPPAAPSRVPSTALESPAAKVATLAPKTPAESPAAKQRSTPPKIHRAPPPPTPLPDRQAVTTLISGVTPSTPQKKHTPPQGTPKRLDPEVSGEPQPFPLTRGKQRAQKDGEVGTDEDGWEPPLAPEASLGKISKPPSQRAPTAPGLGAVAVSPRTAALRKAQQLIDGQLDHEIEIEETAELDDDVMDALAREEEAPLAPSSRSVAYGPRRLRPRQSAKELALPSVIIDVERDCSELVEKLISGDAEASDRLIEIGEPAMSVLVARFPGPVTIDARRLNAESVRASECGPVLRTIAYIGDVAVPFLVVRSADVDPDVRAWATRLLGEMPTMESARAVARRFLDSEENVRRAALAAARLLQTDEEARAALRDGLAQVAADNSQPEEVRLAAIEGLAEVRDPRAVPRLIPLLALKESELAKHAHWALTVLTREDLGREPRVWHDWWRENGSRHRVEWLIDALMHESAEIRRAAGDELKSLTKEYFGYYDDLPKRERAKAQAKYREWWDTRGKARFP